MICWCDVQNHKRQSEWFSWLFQCYVFLERCSSAKKGQRSDRGSCLPYFSCMSFGSMFSSRTRKDGVAEAVAVLLIHFSELSAQGFWFSSISLHLYSLSISFYGAVFWKDSELGYLNWTNLVTLTRWPVYVLKKHFPKTILIEKTQYRIVSYCHSSPPPAFIKINYNFLTFLNFVSYNNSEVSVICYYL